MDAEIKALMSAPDEILATEAERLLGYRRTQEQVAKHRHAASFMRTLKDEGVRPYTPESVKRYEEAFCQARVPFLIRLQTAARDFFDRGGWGSFVCGAILISGCVGGVAAIISAIVSLISKNWGMSSWVVPIGLGLFFTFVFLFFPSPRVDKGSWRRTRLSDYAEPVPTQVLHLAVRLKKAIPDAQFFVEYHSLIPADPFLIIAAGGVEEYIRFWDEKGYVPELKV